ncbi:unnamed protein product [Penicillium salamii]|uniref:Myb-like domain-containing protein n=1 Tax=Penicillium salamii TaxID=1612424 RepID=A0A9W4NFE2_9EURO|nr:unnamed protein product [Penicillium salamii]CAG8118228.1 unnamed protein product [Penicillium salamii]CAG8336834.1 unnamed protein product [Penicillium salamii]CAG8372226.1 unnamed protein product [Penicillium salamii]
MAFGPWLCNRCGSTALDETARIEGGGPTHMRGQRHSPSIKQLPILFKCSIRQKPINIPSPSPLASALYPIPPYLSAPFLIRFKTTSAGFFWLSTFLKMSSTNFRLESFRPWNPFQDKAQPLRGPPGTRRYPSPVSITTTPPSSNNSDHGPKSQEIHSHKPERHPLPARPPTEVCLDGLHSETQTTRRESEGLGQTLSAVSDPEPLNFENISQPQNIVGADEVVSTGFADELHWETEHHFLDFGLDDSRPVDFAGQRSQIVDLGIPTQNGELPNFETIDPAILNDHASAAAEQAQRTMSIAGIATDPEEFPAESIRSQNKVSSLQHRRNSKGMVDTDCQTSKVKKGSGSRQRHTRNASARPKKRSSHCQSISFPTVRAHFSALSVEDRLQFLSWLFEGALTRCSSAPSSAAGASPSSQCDEITDDCDHMSLNTQVVDAEHTSLRKGLPWSVEEDHLLIKLRDKQNLAWPEVVKQFSRKFPGRSEGSMKVHWSTALKKKRRSYPLVLIP